MIAAEGQLVVAQEIDALMALWSEDGYVADARHTPDQPEDDQHWRGVDAIRHRYVRIVFPGAPTNVTPSDMEVEIAAIAPSSPPPRASARDRPRRRSLDARPPERLLVV